MSSPLSYSLSSLRRLSGVSRCNVYGFSNNTSHCTALQPCHLMNMFYGSDKHCCTVRCFASAPVEAEISTGVQRINDNEKEFEPKVKRSLVIKSWFKQPDYGMESYDQIVESSAFLLSVDGKDPVMDEKENSGQVGGSLNEMGWLEFVPKEDRPSVHIVSSSHTLSPFLWKEYYPFDWLNMVNQQHVKYTLEVYDNSINHCESASSPDNNEEFNEPIPLATIELVSDPIHQPDGRDIGILHFREEAEALKILQQHGVEKLFLRSPDKLFQKGEAMMIDGFYSKKIRDHEVQDEEPTCLFPFLEHAKLAYHDMDRFYATTPTPLPEGVCGSPVIDADGDCCGIIEGFLPVAHPNKKVAGSAAFVPSVMLRDFADFVERNLLAQMLPKSLFQIISTAKQANLLRGINSSLDERDTYENGLNEAYDLAISKLKQKYTPDELQALMKKVHHEWDDKEMDIHNASQQVREKALMIREMVKDQYMKERQKTSQPDLESNK